jgi:IS605 OrfB family transposase
MLIIKSKLENEIVLLSEEILEFKSKPKSKSTIRKIFKLTKKLTYKNKQLSKDIIFGGSHILKRLSYLNNDKLSNREEIDRVKEIWINNRALPYSVCGSKHDKNSNRYFEFNFKNNEIYYKQGKNKIKLTFKCKKNIKEILNKLDNVKNSKLLPISVRLNEKNIFITFDNLLLTDYVFDFDNFNKDVNGIDKIKDKLKYKEVAKKYSIELKNRKLEGKLEKRYCGIDLNPQYIGLTIMDKDEDNFNIIDKYTIDLSTLLKKNNKSSSDKNSKYLNNKRKYEIGRIYKFIFKQIKHYKVSNFVMEQLNFKGNDLGSKESNRKIKNVWNLNYQQELIKKHCLENGVELIEVNPVYSSLIGNIMFNDFDPTNASTEITRRGIFKYIKGNFYPILTNTIIDNVIDRFKKSISDVQYFKDCESWKELYKLLNETGCRYRWSLSDNKFNDFSLFNTKSNVKIIKLSC